jgi:hypothetical protein
MSIFSLSECKKLLGITDNKYDESISLLIPLVQADIGDYCNNTFCDTTIYRQSDAALAFVRGSTVTATTQADRITDAESWLSTSGFRAGHDIFVSGGSNSGFHTLAAVAAGTLTLTSTGEIEDQSQVVYHRHPGEISITRVKWPPGLKPIAAKMVWTLIDKPTQGDIKSESVDDYSVTYAGNHAYPERVISGLRQYRKVILV